MKRALLILLLAAVFLSVAAAASAADVSQEASYLWNGSCARAAAWPAST